MSVKGGPNTVTSGLVLELDAGNTKSYPGTGTTWFDKSGNAYNGTLINGPTFNTGSGGSIVFDGVDDYMGIVPSVLTTTTDITMEVWFNPSNLASNQRIFYCGNSSSNGYGFYMGVCGGTATTLSILFGGKICSAVSKTGITNNTWYHAIFTRTTTPSTLNTLYINGASVSINTTNSPNAPTQQIGYGVSAGGIGEEYFPGKIPICRIYNRALSADEVLQNYNATKTRFGL